MEARVPTSKAEALAVLEAFGTRTDVSWLSPLALVHVPVSYDDKTDLAYYKARIEAIQETDVQVRLLEGPLAGSENAIQTVPQQDVFALDPDSDAGIEDMAKLSYLSEAALLNNLRVRYAKQEIYTFVGPTLIAINPYAQLPGFYTQEMIARFADESIKSPHIFRIAATALSQLWENSKNQAIVISGESGAGKTENTKYAMRFLASSAGGKSGVEAKVLQCNPILESFGNAKTVRNDNSSRFGKYVRIFFDATSQVVAGSSISNYLLEKTRVVRQMKGERNFHIFYSFLSSAPRDLLDALCLTPDPTKYHYLNQSDVYRIPTLDDALWFAEVQSALQAVGITEKEQRSIWTVLATVLNLGNIEFQDTEFVEDSTKPCKATPETALFLNQAGKLLGVSVKQVEQALTFFVRKVGSTEIPSPISKDDCTSFRDSLAKALYDKLFNWLVLRLNDTLAPATSSNTYIGLLDIFGFELFAENSFEQFCINYTNEKLQQLYIAYVFKAESQEFQDEGLSAHVSRIQFVDNQPIIDLLEGYPVGIFNLVDEACTVNSDDKKLIGSIIKQHKKNQFFAVPRMDKEKFIIFHSARDVDYRVTGFKSKNMDELRPELQQCGLSSSDPIISSLFRKVEEDAPARTGKFLGPKFRKQMQNLMEELHNCDCHFIRCIKPNEDKAEWKFFPRLVLVQVQYLGVLDSIKVRRESYPIRKQFKYIYGRYEELHPNFRAQRFSDIENSDADWRPLALKVLEVALPGIGPEYYMIGTSKVFMKTEVFALLEQLRGVLLREKIRAAGKIQIWWRVTRSVLRFQNLRKAVITIQRKWRAGSLRIHFLAMKRAAGVIGAWMRKVIRYRQFKHLQSVAVLMQGYARTKLTRIHFLQTKRSIRLIQRITRGFLSRKRVRQIRMCKELVYTRVLKAAWDRINFRSRVAAAVKIQSVWRGHRTREKNKGLVTRLRTTLRNRKQGRAVIHLQAWFRGMQVRLRLQRVTRAAKYIQGYFKAKWTHALFHKTRVEATRIKNALRAFTIKRQAIRSRLEEYLEHETALLENQRLVEFSVLFTHINIAPSMHTEELRALSELAESSAVQNKLLLTSQGSLAVQTKPVSPFHLERLYLFSRVIDLDMLTDLSIVYEPMWSQQLESLVHECALAEEQVLAVEVGACHSCALTSRGKLFAWGWNDRRQLGSSKPALRPHCVDALKESRILQVACGNDHSLALDDLGQVFAFGDNSKGQLGQGNYKDTSGAVQVSGLSGKVSIVAAVGSQSFAVSADGEAYMWPYETYGGERRSSPVRIPTTSPVVEISLGFQFGVFVVANGLVYSFGQCNDEGQLGHGDREPRFAPEVIPDLKSTGEKVQNVSCGFKHVICRTHLGKVYTWGCGRHGQLGHSTTASQLSPRQLYIRNPTQRLKVVQCQAGWRHSVIMLENRVLMWFGTNGELTQQTKPTKIKLNEKLPEFFSKKQLEEEFAPVKVSTSWSRSACVTTVVVADVRYLKIPKPKVQTALGLLAEKWRNRSAIYQKANSQNQRVKLRKPDKKGDAEVTVMKRRIQELLEKPEDQWTEDDRIFKAEITRKAL